MENFKGRLVSVAMVLLAAAQAPGIATAQTVPEPRSVTEIDEIDQYIQRATAGVRVRSQFLNAAGRLLSCVDIDTQPALNHPGVGRAHRVTQPSAQLEALLNGPIRKDETPTPCVEGTVPIALPDREAILRAGSLRNYLSKTKTAPAERR